MKLLILHLYNYFIILSNFGKQKPQLLSICKKSDKDLTSPYHFNFYLILASCDFINKIIQYNVRYIVSKIAIHIY